MRQHCRLSCAEIRDFGSLGSNLKEKPMRNRLIGGTGRLAAIICLLLTLAGCVVAPAYGPGPYYHPYHGYYHYYD
jgi:hypothetical protein